MDNLLEKLSKYRLSKDEYEMICARLGREPLGVEWALFSALWSEHCSYKSSKIHFKRFFTQNESVVVSEGENAGVLDLGEGERISFKMESHNHPSFIEPYQGAATGVGGILRDIFTMGARPIMQANYLCFGESHAPRMKEIVGGVVSGISGYGNCVGVPTVTGATHFHKSYNQNILVNAFALGVLYPEDKMALSKAQGPGNLVVYVGAKTGRDGIHGASMASESFHEDSDKNRPTVQIGDPFLEKLLIEACIEVINQDLVVAIQDMGAAGVTSSSFEMASKGGLGLHLDLDKVPLRDVTLSPEDILLSESQERMLLICEPDKYERIKEVFHRWGLSIAIIGEVLSSKEMKLYWKGDLLTKIDPDILVESAPRYERPYKIYQRKKSQESSFTVQNIQDTLEKILFSEMGLSRKWIYSQYDQRVGGNTALDCSSSIGAVRLEHTHRGLGVSLGCRPYLMRLDTYVGSRDAIYGPALCLSIKGFEPLAVTDCLNFGNPEQESVMTDFVASVEGLSEACRTLNTPIISGNVSFYNETQSKSITSTPSIGMVGIRHSVLNIPKDSFSYENQSIYLVYKHVVSTGGATEELLTSHIHYQNIAESFEGVSDWIGSLQRISNSEEISSNISVGKFGLLYSLFKMSSDHFGFFIDRLPEFIKTKEDLFKERLYEVLYVPRDDEAFEKSLDNLCLTYIKIGKTTRDFQAKVKNFGDLNLEKLRAIHADAWENNFC